MIIRRGIVATACWLLAAGALQAQYETATVLGTVRDSSNAVVAGASIALENLGTGIRDTATSNTEGNFQFLSVKIGRYLIRIESSGFRTAISAPFDVVTGAHQRVDMALQIGATSESITVTGAALQLETDSSDRGHVIRATEIEALPLNGRAYADLALLSPGVRQSTISTSRDASFNVNGQRSQFNTFTLDGTDNNSYANSNQGYSNQVIQPSPDSLAEFKVQINNYSAEYGRASGAVVNASMKSGTNEVHGAAWEFLRNTSLNAIGFFKPTTGKPTLVQNQYGFTVGGPIVKNRTFFFFDYEGYRSISRTLSWQTMPTLDQRNGIESIPVVDYRTKIAYPNNVIPTTAIGSLAKKVVSDLPLPNVNIAGSLLNYQYLPRTKTFYDKGDLKLDHRFSDKFNVFARFSQRKVNGYVPATFEGPDGVGSAYYNRILNQGGVLSANYLPSPRTLIEVRLGYNRTVAGVTPEGIGGPNMYDTYGISGLPTDPKIAGGLYNIGWTSYPNLGRSTSRPQSQNPAVKNPKVTFSRFFGAHTLKAGYEWQQINMELDDFNPKYGSTSYSSQWSKPSSASSNYVYTLTDLLLGNLASYSLSTATIANLRQRMHFAYLQDDWKVNANLTLNLGVRYEYGTPQYERDNHLANFNPSTGTMDMGAAGSIFNRSRVNPDRNNFAPRLGFAYRLKDNLVARGGYGVSYIHFNRLGGESVLAYNWPFEFTTKINQLTTQDTCTNDLNPAGCFRTPEMGFPQGMLSTSISTLANQSYIYYQRPNLRTGYVQNWHFTIQRTLPKEFLLDIGYIGSKGTRMMVLGDLNQKPAPSTAKPYPTLQSIETSFDGGFSTYHGLQVKLERRFSDGLYLLNSFTYSHAIDNAAGHLEVAGGDNSRVNLYGLGQEKGTSSYNQPLNDTTTVVWSVPFGKGRKFGSQMNPVVESVLGGWGLSAINTMTSGSPVTLRYSPSGSLSVSGLPSYRPNVIGDPLAPEATRSPNMYLNKSALSIPSDWPFGNAARNTLRGFSYYNLNLALMKTFALGSSEKRRLEFRTEAFNLMNKTNFAVPDANMSNATFGQITSAQPARVVQFGLKLYY
jgi:hypothetical protein